jgi:hypothetical protein
MPQCEITQMYPHDFQKTLKRRAYAKLDDDKPGYLLWDWRPGLFLDHGEPPPTERLFPKLLTFVYTATACQTPGFRLLLGVKRRIV